MLAAQLVTTIVVSVGYTAVSGLLVLSQGNRDRYLVTLMVAPLLAVFGSAVASVVRNAVYLFVGCAVWILFVEAMYGKLREPLPFSAYLDAAGGDRQKLLVLAGWTAAAIAGAGFAIRRDLSGD